VKIFKVKLKLYSSLFISFHKENEQVSVDDNKIRFSFIENLLVLEKHDKKMLMLTFK
jgi:hypothetical protein